MRSLRPTVPSITEGTWIRRGKSDSEKSHS